jgi:hypothetical protein
VFAVCGSLRASSCRLSNSWTLASKSRISSFNFSNLSTCHKQIHIVRATQRYARYSTHERPYLSHMGSFSSQIV